VMAVKRYRVSMTLSAPYRDALDLLVKKGLYLEKQEAIRDALRLFFEIRGIPPFYPEGERR